MANSNVDKWTPFMLSLMLPGAGQLLAGSWSALPWFAAAGAVGAIWSTMPGIETAGATAMRIVSLAMLGICSAEHAKRLLEARSTHSHVTGRPKISCRRRARGNVRMKIVLDVRLSVAALWKRVGDLPRFLTIDPFHQQIVLLGDQPASGVGLVLHHNVFGIRLSRFGRVLRWQEGIGYTISDLSARGCRRGFPHVFMIDVAPLNLPSNSSGEQSRLTITICGKWTSAWLPLSIGRWWLWAVCREHGRLLRKAL